MSNTIDQRVVEMRFDNKQFESNVQTSMSTIDKLKQSLNLTGASKGFENISAAAENCNVSALSGALETVRGKFSALEVMAVTALANITNSVVNTGKKIVSSLTIEPIKSGFQEYETQINAVQTILANTSSKQEEVSKEAIDAIKETALQSAIVTEEANAQTLENIKSAHEQQLKEYSNRAKDELDILEDKYDDEADALEKAINEENKILKQAHNEKLDLYHEEYMEKLKVIDEDRYNKIKAIDDEIDSINGLTKAEEEELKKAKQRKKLSELQNKVYEAETFEERKRAEENLADYKDELAREQLLKERDTKIKSLETDKSAINEAYELQKEQIKSEYEEKKDTENKLYELESENLKENQAERKKALKDTYDTEKEFLKEKHDAEKEALRDRQSAEISAMNERHKIALNNIESEKNAQIKALTLANKAVTKGSSLEDVNKALDELNYYADKTIYNFTEMTRNIGTFTAAGVDLNTSVSAIKGIANLAAVSGSTSQQASSAMYQLSQAIASGSVKLMDWNSVVNAGMGGKVFQDALKETARVHGIAIDEMIAEEGSFRETLSNGWLSSEILTETLSKFTGDLTEEQLKTMGYTEDQIASIIEMGQVANDAATKVKTFTQLFDTLKEAAQSGWTQSWEIIVGDFEEAKELLTEVSDIFGNIIGSSANARNEMLQGWKDLGGRTAVIEAVKNAFEGVLSIITPVKEAFQEIFPPITGEQLAAFSEGLRKLTEHFKLSETASDALKRTFKGIFAGLDILKQAFSDVLTAISPLFKGIDNLGGGILNVTASLGDWVVEFRDTISETDIFNEVMKKVVGVIETVASAVKKVIDFIKEKLSFPGFENFHALLERIQKRMSQVGEAAGNMKSGVVIAVEAIGSALANSKFIQLMESIWNFVKALADGISKILSGIASDLTDKLGNANFDGVFDLINSLSLGGIALGISNFLKSLTEPLEGLQGIIDGVTGALDGVRGCLEAYQTSLKADALLKIAFAIAILAASILVISLIDSDKLTASLGGITVLFADLMGSMAVFDKISGSAKGVTKSIAAMLGISIAVLILASALKKISDLNLEELGVGITGIASLTAIIVAAAKIMESSGKSVAKGAIQMILFAAAVSILASACEDLSSLSWEELAKGLVGVGVLLAEIVLFMNTAKFSGKSITTATGIVILAAAIKVLASACEDFGNMEWEEIAKGLTGVGLLLAEVAAFTKLTGNAKHVISSGVALIAIGAAIKILASAIQDFAGMTWEELARGLTGMAGALVAVVAALNFMPKNTIGIGVGLISVSAALVILAEALNKMGNMSWEEIAKGLIALGGSMTILAVGLNVMNGTLAGSAAMLVAAAALAVLTPVLSILGAMSWESIAKGLVALAGAFAIIGVAGLVLTPIVPAILGLAGAFALIGVGVLAVGAGLLAAGAGLSALAVGFTALAAAGAAGATAIVAALTVIVTGVAGLIPAVIEKIGEGVIAFCKVISEGAPELGKAIKAVVLTLIDVLTECIPAIVDGALALITEILKSLVKYTPQIVDSLLQFVIELLNGVARNLPQLIQAVVDVIMALFTGVIDALRGMDVEVLVKGIAGIGLLSGIMVALSAVAALIPGAMVGVLGMGVVIAELAVVLAAIGALAQIPGLSWLVNEGGKLLEGIGIAIGSFIGGIVGGVMSGISSQFPQIGSDLSGFMTNIQPFIDGAKTIDTSVMDGVKLLVETILLLTAANVLDSLASWLTGESSLTAFAKELAAFGPKLKEYAESIKGIDNADIVSSANAAKVIAEMASNLPRNGGVTGWFRGESSLSAFATELAAFGPKLKEYGESIKGLGVEDIEKSVNAAVAIADMASNLPKSGGVVGWFLGENSLSVFATELASFGPKLKEYAQSVAGLGGADIESSVNAAKVLSEFAANLPNKGGVVSWFTGNNDIGTFGESLEIFGEHFAGYYGYIKDVKSEVVSATANAAKVIVELQNGLPKSGGWFSNTTTIDDFGKDMKAFGEHFKKYYEQVSSIDTSKLSGVIESTNGLVSLAKGMSEINSKGMSEFGSSLGKLGKDGINGFIKAFTDSESKVKNKASDMVTTFINGANDKKISLTNTFSALIQSALDAINEKKGSFKSSAQSLLVNFTDGVNGKKLEVKTNFTTLIQSILDIVDEKKSAFKSASQSLMTEFINGVISKGTSVSNNFITIVNGALSAIKNKYNDFYNTGVYLVDGFIGGIASNISKAEAKSKEMAAAAAKAAAEELDEHSPSKVGYRIGDFFGLAFVNAIGKYSSISYRVGSEMAESAKEGLSKAVSNISDIIALDIDLEPTIRPVLDLSNIQNGTNRLHRIMRGIDGQALSGSIIMANQTAENVNRRVADSYIRNDVNDNMSKAVKDLASKPSRIFENTFNITGNNPKEIAEEVSRIIQRQVDRREASWA
jgi:tape measure domain-containing protein